MHHYLPVSYLKRFADQHGFLHVLDFHEQRRFKTKPQNVAKIRDYYTAETAERTDDVGVERMLSVFESNAEPVFDRIIRENRIPLESEAWDHACAFIALLDQRLPIAREAYKQSADWMMNLIDERCISANVHQNSYIQMMLETSKRLAPLIGEMTPHLLVSNDAEFITGDCPLAKRDRQPSDFYGLGWAVATIEVGLPIGRHHCIVLTWDPAPRVLRADRDAVANVNCQIAQWAMRYVLGPRDNFVWMDRDESVKSGARLLFQKMSAPKVNRKLIQTWPPGPKRAARGANPIAGGKSAKPRGRRRRKK